MAIERWVGRFFVEYDEVDIEQFEIEARSKKCTLRSVLEKDAIARAAKAYRGLRKKTVVLHGDRNARAIFATSIFHTGGQKDTVDEY